MNTSRSRALLILVSAGLALVVLAAIAGPWISPYDPDVGSDRQFEPPSLSHWMGTDIHGRDVFTRTLHGARISLLVGFVGAAVSVGVGVLYGLVSGYIGGRTDAVMMRLVDILASLPRIIIVIVVMAVLDEWVKDRFAAAGLHDWISSSRLIILFIVLGLVEWMTMARIVRGQILSLKERAFIQAAHVMGQSHPVIMFRHLLPNLAGIILVYLTLTIPAVILEESFLSFLGLGVQAPGASWGTLLSDGAGLINPVRIPWWLLTGPALVMGFTLLCLNFLGDALRDRFDPRSRDRS
jgi:peptide/nickel transport system permease protein/oligopeptide transport system permease protein